MITHQDFLDRAVELGEIHMDAGAGGPFGAVVVRDGQIIAEGWNSVLAERDPTAHAEIVAIRRACRALDRFSLEGAVLYSSCEPCPMCLAAIYWARLDGLYYAACQQDAAEAGFDDAYIYRELTKPWPERALKARQGAADEARRVFRIWCAKPDKVQY